jgi:hypothetical protein
MIDLVAVDKAIVRGLEAALSGLTVAEANSPAKMPPYPFVSYNIIDVGDNDFTLSFNAHGETRVACITLVQEVRDWFIGPGHQALKDAVNVVVVTVEAADNRDVQIGNMWERKYGFDVDFRTVGVWPNKETDWTTEVIEKADIERTD